MKIMQGSCLPCGVKLFYIFLMTAKYATERISTATAAIRLHFDVSESDAGASETVTVNSEL